METVIDTATYRCYLPTLIQTPQEFMKEISFLYFYSGDAEDLVVMRILPNKTQPVVIYQYRSNKVSTLINNMLNKAWTIILSLIQNSKVAIPETGLAWLVDVDCGEPVYDLVTDTIIDYAAWEMIPPNERYAKGGVLLSWVKENGEVGIARTSSRVTKGDVAMFLFLETQTLVKQFSTAMGRSLVSQLMCEHYKIPEPADSFLEWCINPQQVEKIPYTALQIQKLIGIKVDMPKASENLGIISWSDILDNGVPLGKSGWCRVPPGKLRGVRDIYCYYGRVTLVPEDLMDTEIDFNEVARVLNIPMTNIVVREQIML